jgi:hypothetical protein
MDIGEYLKRYFEYLGSRPITAGNIRGAAASASKTEPPAGAIEAVLAHAEAHGVNPEKELAELHAAREAAKAETAERERRAKVKATLENIKSKIEELSGAADTAAMADLSEALAALNAETAGLITSAAAINRFPTWADYEAAWKNENDDFMPRLFGNLGFPEGSVSYIGARTGRGKTTAMVNIGIEALFSRQTRRVLFITLEENQKQILRRFSLCLAYRDADNVTRAALLLVTSPRTGKRDPKNLYKMWKQGQEITIHEGVKEFLTAISIADDKIRHEVESGNLIFFDGISARMYEIKAAIEQTRRGDIVLLDYIQQIPPSKESRSGNPDLERIRDGSKQLKDIAKAKNCIVISGAQFNRDSQKRTAGDDEFTDADFRGCGDLEQDGHNLIGIGRSADMVTHYFKTIKGREAEITDECFTLDFAGGYSYMAIVKDEIGQWVKYDIKTGPIKKPSKNPTPGNKDKQPEKSGALGESKKPQTAAAYWQTMQGGNDE